MDKYYDFKCFVFTVLLFLGNFISECFLQLKLVGKALFLITFIGFFGFIFFFTSVKNFKIWKDNLYIRYFKNHIIAKKLVNMGILLSAIGLKLDYVLSTALGVLVVGILIPVFLDKLIKK